MVIILYLRSSPEYQRSTQTFHKYKKILLESWVYTFCPLPAPGAEVAKNANAAELGIALMWLTFYIS